MEYSKQRNGVLQKKKVVSWAIEVLLVILVVLLHLAISMPSNTAPIRPSMLRICKMRRKQCMSRCREKPIWNQRFACCG